METFQTATEMLRDLPTAWILSGPLLIVASVMLVVKVIKSFLYICAPNEILIFSGRTHTTADGREVGFRVIFGGRAFRVPILEKVNAMDMRLLSVPMTIVGAYSQGGIPLSVQAIANVKISSNPALVGNAIERFLGHDVEAIARVAKETLEGHLRGVLANMTPEEVNEDRLMFTNRLAEEAGGDLQKLGLQLDTLNIQHVSDDRGYLDSIGRSRIAEVLRDAEVAESDAIRSAEKAEADAGARGKVGKTQAQANVARRANALRQQLADLEGEAKSEEARAEAAALEARADAERELQRIRGELEQLRLTAEVTVPAEMEQRVRELEAVGQAASIAENGKAMALALQHIADAWKSTDGKAMDMVVLQHIEPLLQRVASVASELKLGQVSLIDAGDGATVARYASAGPAVVGALLKEISSTLGVDIPRVLTGQKLEASAR